MNQGAIRGNGHDASVFELFAKADAIFELLKKARKEYSGLYVMVCRHDARAARMVSSLQPAAETYNAFSFNVPVMKAPTVQNGCGGKMILAAVQKQNVPIQDT